MKNKNAAMCRVRANNKLYWDGHPFENILYFEAQQDNTWLLTVEKYTWVGRGSGYFILRKPEIEYADIYIGDYEEDFIRYKGKIYARNDFPKLATLIYNRNIKETLKVLK